MFDLQSAEVSDQTRLAMRQTISGRTHSSARGRRGFSSPRGPRIRWRDPQKGASPAQYHSKTSRPRMQTALAGWRLQRHSTQTRKHNLAGANCYHPDIMLARGWDVEGLTVDYSTGTEQDGPLLRETLSQLRLAIAGARERLLGRHHAGVTGYRVEVVEDARQDPRQLREHDKRLYGPREVVGPRERRVHREVGNFKRCDAKLPVIDVTWPT